MKHRKVIVIILFTISFGLFTYSLLNIAKWFKDNDSTNKVIKKINETVDVEEIEDTEDIVVIPPEEMPEELVEEPKEEKVDPYWEFIGTNLINVDFSDLKEVNKDVIGWIKVEGTNINYPFVQAADNSYYLTHTFDRSYNRAGWVFLDYRNNLTNGRNTILYAHGRINTTMFGSLNKILTNGWTKDANNYIIKISTVEESSLWQIFSAYHIPTTNDYIQTDFRSDEEFGNFLNTLKGRSMFDFRTSIGSTDKILTLSTCYNEFEKMVVHAKLIKKMAR